MNPFHRSGLRGYRLAARCAVHLLATLAGIHSTWAATMRPADAPPGAGLPAIAPAQAPAALPDNAQRISHGLLRDVIVYQPTETASSFVILLSGEQGPSAMTALAQALTRRGALVAAVDTPGFIATLERMSGDCRYPAGDLDNLSHFIQAYYRLPTYFRPLLAGYSSGASLAYAALAQTDGSTFAGALAIAYRPQLAMSVPLCPSRALTVRMRPGTAVMDFLPTGAPLPPIAFVEGDRDPGADDARKRAPAGRWLAHSLESFPALQKIAARESLPPPPADLSGLPILELPAQPARHRPGTFAVLLSGDGGWGSMVKRLAATLASRGVPVVGIDTLRYFWTPRTPGSAAADVDRIIQHYRRQWHRPSVMLLGYSQGADVLPFIYNRLPPATRRRVRLTEVMGVGAKVMFAYRRQEPFSGDGLEGSAVIPELEKMASPRLLCIYGASEHDSTCPQLDASRSTVERFSGGHDAGGDTTLISQAILEAAHLN